MLCVGIIRGYVGVRAGRYADAAFARSLDKDTCGTMYGCRIYSNISFPVVVRYATSRCEDKKMPNCSGQLGRHKGRYEPRISGNSTEILWDYRL